MEPFHFTSKTSSLQTKPNKQVSPSNPHSDRGLLSRRSQRSQGRARAQISQGRYFVRYAQDSRTQSSIETGSKRGKPPTQAFLHPSHNACLKLRLEKVQDLRIKGVVFCCLRGPLRPQLQFSAGVKSLKPDRFLPQRLRASKARVCYPKSLKLL